MHANQPLCPYDQLTDNAAGILGVAIPFLENWPLESRHCGAQRENQMTTFRPTNRYISELIPLPGSDATIGGVRILLSEWFVDDVDCKGNPIAYRSDDCPSRVLPDRGKFIICSDRGRYLRHPKKPGSTRKPPVRRFKTAFEAAVEAHCLHETQVTW
jgi:hypothetical protein